MSYILDEISGRITYTQAYTFAERCLNTVTTSNWTANTSIKDKKLVLIEKKTRRVPTTTRKKKRKIYKEGQENLSKKQTITKLLDKSLDETRRSDAYRVIRFP